MSKTERLMPDYNPTIGEIFGKKKETTKCLNVVVDRIIIDASPRIRVGSSDVSITGLDVEQIDRLFEQVHQIFLRERVVDSDGLIAICFPNKQLYAKFSTWRFNKGFGEIYKPAGQAIGKGENAPKSVYGLKDDVVRVRPECIIDIATGLPEAHVKAIVSNMTKSHKKTGLFNTWHFVSVLDFVKQEMREDKYLSALRTHAMSIDYNEPSFIEPGELQEIE